MLSRLLILCFMSTSVSAAVSEDGKFASLMVQVNLTKYERKSGLCHQQMRNFKLREEDKIQLKALPHEASDALGKLLDDALNSCAQPELFNLSKSILVLEEQNKLDNSTAITSQIEGIRKLIFSKNIIAEERAYDNLPISLKEKLEKIEFLKKPFDLFEVIEQAWDAPQ
ncbi:hypothetical protein [Shewanella salipaludis]|uniref:Uncharacterized protein n=2 Tax=Shewanella TaxID=22 RepID=A0A972G1I0_9GAMM|nr:hypothetical protein [Shewanella salipaludis]NMH66587.1 hypothetical protein [Shewanella salipaludis]